MQSRFRTSISRYALFLALLGVLQTGCVYRLTVQQGNLVDQDKVDQIETGMTRKQVRFLLGTPMVDDPFNKDRWDYIYRVQPGRAPVIDKRWITIFFDSDTVERVIRGESANESDTPPEVTTSDQPESSDQSDS